MPEIGTSGSMSGDGKRSVAAWPKLPRPSSTLPKAAAERTSVDVSKVPTAAIPLLRQCASGGSGWTMAGWRIEIRGHL
jgi:hypothetical protein